MIYYINTETKEHTLERPLHLPGPTYSVVEADPDGWIPWHGGECPLPKGEACDVRLKSSETATQITASAWQWLSFGNRGDIVAYRPACYHQNKFKGLWQDAEGTILVTDYGVTDYGQPVGRIDSSVSDDALKAVKGHEPTVAPEKPQEHDTLAEPTHDPLAMLRSATADTEAALKAIQDALPDGYRIVRDGFT